MLVTRFDNEVLSKIRTKINRDISLNLYTIITILRSYGNLAFLHLLADDIVFQPTIVMKGVVTAICPVHTEQITSKFKVITVDNNNN